MLKMFKKNEKKNKGFTLVELIIVIAILAILVGILAPQYTKYVEKSRKSADANNIDNVVQAIMVASADDEYSLPKGTYKVTLSKTDGLKVEGSETALTVVNSADSAKNGPLTNALIEYMGNDANSAEYASGNATYANTKLKSEKWGGSTPVDEIVATVNVSETGAVSVTYSPEDFAAYAGTGNTAESDDSNP